jgi:hypothetical protein
VQSLSTAFDGKYAGTATQTASRADVSCRTIASVTMTITGGKWLSMKSGALEAGPLSKAA